MENAHNELGIAHCSICLQDTEGYVQQAEGKHADLAGFVRLAPHDNARASAVCIGSGSWFKPLT